MTARINRNKNTSIAVFGGGCFWCIEAVFARLKGVKKAISGYAGGPMPAGANIPTYDEVCSGNTGHAEVIKIEFNPRIIAYNELLKVFFAMHDPTTLNRQGADVGTQYRSIILYSDDIQKREAENFIRDLENEKIFLQPIVTEIKKLADFYPADNYHQKYFDTNPRQPYCRFNISPKISKLEKNFTELLK